MAGGSIPPCWDKNPTAWSRRLPVTAMALVGLGIASYLTLYQVGILQSAWDPFFPEGSRKVLTFTSPFPDASLGVLAYLTEIVLSLIGGSDRWRTMPWAVLAFGAVISIGALVSIMLIIVQPVFVGAWCTLCVASALISMAIFIAGVREPLAGLQYLKQVHVSGNPVWRALWGLDVNSTQPGTSNNNQGTS